MLLSVQVTLILKVDPIMSAPYICHTKRGNTVLAKIVHCIFLPDCHGDPWPHENSFFTSVLVLGMLIVKSFLSVFFIVVVTSNVNTFFSPENSNTNKKLSDKEK